jgi:NADPH-dependent 2,4-dienoyl-CoA reductase/sulfur reductase-like enzyme
MVRNLVLIGGDAAGMSAASQARRLLGVDELAITVLERGETTSYAACGIPYWVAGLVPHRSDLVARRAEVFRDKQQIDVRLHHEATAIDTDARTVSVRDLTSGAGLTLSYDDLLIATGAQQMRPPVDGLDTPGVFGVQTLGDGQRILDAMAQRSPRHAVVVGGGYIGLEMAEAMQLQGLAVTLIDLAPQPMTTLEPELGALIADAIRTMGIDLRLQTPLSGIEAGADGWVRAVTTPGGEIATDLVIIGTGVRPRSELAAAAGIPVGPSGGIVTDDRQRTPVDRVWAAGDCAETLHRVSRLPVSLALGTIANKQGRIAGLNLGGGEGRFPGVLGTAVTKIHDLEIARTGLSVREAEAAGLSVEVSSITAGTRAHYYPQSSEMTVLLVIESGSGRLLGGQIVGGLGAGKRIDVLATALWNRMQVKDLVQMDLAYAPPFSPVWDPVLTAARSATGNTGRDAGKDAGPNAR